MSFPEPIILNTGLNEPAEYAVIWLHGLGADGHDFETIVPQLDLPSHLNIRFIFPTAAEMFVGVAHQVMRSWYDFPSMNFREEVDEEGLASAVTYLHQLIEEQIKLGINSTHILLAGFSQGGAVILAGGLAYPKPLAGLMALSTYYPKAACHPFGRMKIKQPVQCPIFWGHGRYDDICPLLIAKASQAELKTLGYSIVKYDYPMAHQVCAEEIKQMSLFIQEVF